MSTRPIKLEDIAVIVATRNDGSTLRACVDSLLVAGQGQAELIFVDDASTDETSAILFSYGERIRVLEGQGLGPGKARNFALRKTTRRWIAFTDGDCEVDQAWLVRLAQELSAKSEEWVSAGGPQLIPSQAEPTEREIAEFLQTVGFVSDYVHRGKEVRRVAHNPTCNVLYDRDALDQVGGFDERLWPCEDLDLDLRLAEKGFRFLFHPEACVAHRRPRAWPAFQKMMRRYGFAHAHLVKKHGICQPLHFLPWLVPMVLGGSLILLVWYPYLVLGGLSLGVLGVIGLLAWRTHSLEKGFRFAGKLLAAVSVWLRGFYFGLGCQRRITEKNV